MRKLENFVVKHYSEDKYPSIKGNRFDGLLLGEDREEAEDFIVFVNDLISKVKYAESKGIDFSEMKKEQYTDPIDYEAINYDPEVKTFDELLEEFNTIECWLDYAKRNEYHSILIQFVEENQVELRNVYKRNLSVLNKFIPHIKPIGREHKWFPVISSLIGKDMARKLLDILERENNE